MSAKTEDAGAAIDRLEADAKYLADHINAIQVRYIAEHPNCRVRYLGDTARDLRTLLASHAAQAERIASLEAELATATRFEMLHGVTIEQRKQTHGEPLWAVTDGSFVLSRSGEWVYEPLPSSRTDEFIQATRFSLAEARSLLSGKASA